ncbi:N5-(carboxyethyl)ornithine synthase [Carnobacterium iners]|uniref:N5-(Carboxyethyl)ornithine synthase n=1 Tax=Carnobacterium iners TaxID=1073423 RepID=A0A1X7N875_9LACT|nr:N(5)-(carboxyethyl)ornithine synthase [Carnobacterium iners]SEL18597.1 N5-(carboxyethyl)ornithine synthase [Carnobacterium iners]SMH33696.1 N5-(carboxyethyl)ornithine synthase [Carnobacterium iners]
MLREKLKSIGFVNSYKDGEKRIALLPKDIAQLRHQELLFFEENYGSDLNISDVEYAALGCQIVSREIALQQDIICDPKIGDSSFLKDLRAGQTLFGWIHAVQSKEITDILMENKLSAYAWEDMYEDNRHCYWRSNELAGEAAVMHAYQLNGLMPYDTKVALIGRGNTAKGALRILIGLGADVKVFNRLQEKLFRKEMPEFDVIVNALLWDTTRTDHIVYQADLKKLKPGTMIVDVSCDENGAIESTIPTSLKNPIYEVDSVIHYAVDHTPTIFYRSASSAISHETAKYIDDLVESRPNDVLNRALIIQNGRIMDKRINEFQNRLPFGSSVKFDRPDSTSIF